MNVIDLTFSVYLIASLVLGIPSNIIIVRIGIRRACILSSVLILIGAIVRVAINSHFIVAPIGQLISGLGAPLAINSIYVFCEQSFEPSQVGLVTAVLSLMMPTGVSIGTILTLLSVHATDLPPDYTDIDIQKFKQNIEMILLMETGICMLVLIFTIAFIRQDNNRFLSGFAARRTTRLDPLTRKLAARKSISSKDSNKSSVSRTLDSSLANLSSGSGFATLAQVEKMMELEEDELQVGSNIGVMKQYQVLLRDPCYLCLAVSGSVLYGVASAFLALLNYFMQFDGPQYKVDCPLASGLNLCSA
jgi:MFS family permease